MSGPPLRTDVIDIYLFRRHPDLQFLQLLRREEPLARTWQPVMGHVEAGEATVAAFWRELREETGLEARSGALLNAWALEEVHPFFVARADAIFLSPRFAVEVAADWSPTLNHEHAEHRWVALAEVPAKFMWPGQIGAIEELTRRVLPEASLCEPILRLARP